MAQVGLNRVMAIGFLGDAPVLKLTVEGKPVTRFRVAVNEEWSDTAGAIQKRVEWIQVVSFGRLAEICGQYLCKGRRVFVEGRLQTRGWEDREGQRRTVTEVVATEVKMLDSPSKNRPVESTKETEEEGAGDAPF